MNILLTGCSSYIGKHISKSLANSGHKIFGISRSDPKIYHDNFRWVQTDLSISFKNIIKEEIDSVIHIAGCSWAGKHTKEYIRSNIFTAYRLIEFIKLINPKLVIYTSSRDVYGEIESDILSEESPILNPSIYGITKYLGEKILEEYSETVILRLPAVIGVGTHGWIQNIYLSLIKNEKIAFVNSPFNNLIHLEDLYGIINSLHNNIKETKTDKIFNVSCTGILTSFEVVDHMKNRLNSTSVLEVIESKKPFYTISNAKLLKWYKPMSVISSINLFLDELIELNHN